MKTLTIATTLVLGLMSASASAFSLPELQMELQNDLESVSKTCIRMNKTQMNESLRLSMHEHLALGVVAEHVEPALSTNFGSIEASALTNSAPQ